VLTFDFAKMMCSFVFRKVIPPPDFGIWEVERVLCYDYDLLQNKWQHSLIMVIMEKSPFAEGGMRRVHKLTDYSTITSARNKVAKFYKGRYTTV